MTHDRALGVGVAELADDVVGGAAWAAARRRRRCPGGKSSAIPAAPIAPSSVPSRRRPRSAAIAAERAQRGADPQRPPVGAVRRLGLDPRLGAELGEALDQPLGGPPLALGGGRAVDLLQFLEPLAQPILGPLAIWREAQLPAYHWAMLGGGSFTLFHVRGIRIAVDWSWFLILFFVIFYLSGSYGDAAGRIEHRDRRRSLLAVASAARLLRLDPPARARPRLRRAAQRDRDHQHPALDLRRHGPDGPRIRQPRQPNSRSPLAGPAVTLAIVVVLTGRRHRRRRAAPELPAGGRVRDRRRRLRRSLALVAWLATINALLLVFNLLPGLPDGRRPRSPARSIWWRTGDRTTATRFAANLGRVFGYLFIAGGLALIALRRSLRRRLAGADRVRDQRRRPRRRDADGADQPDRATSASPT